MWLSIIDWINVLLQTLISIKLNPVMNNDKRDKYKFLDKEKAKRPKPAVPKDWAIIFSNTLYFLPSCKEYSAKSAPAPIELVSIPRVSGPPCSISLQR